LLAWLIRAKGKIYIYHKRECAMTLTQVQIWHTYFLYKCSVMQIV